jgi:WXG100 family type VII secretion target
VADKGLLALYQKNLKEILNQLTLRSILYPEGSMQALDKTGHAAYRALAHDRKDAITMAGQIRITPDVMDQRAGEYRQRESEVNDIISKMDGMLNTLMSEWEGDAARSYQERWTGDLKPSFQRASQLIEEIAVALNKTAGILRDTDAQIAAQLRG